MTSVTLVSESLLYLTSDIFKFADQSMVDNPSKSLNKTD